MSIHWQVDHTARLVTATVEGPLTASDVRSFIDQLAKDGAMPYAKLFNATGADDLLSPPELKQLGSRVRELIMSGHGPLGPLAFVVDASKDHLRAAQYADASGFLRPIRIFKDPTLALRWLERTKSK